MKNEGEWKQIRAETLARYRAMSYVALAALVGTSECEEILGNSGVRYSVQVDVFWDDRPGRDVRVLCAIDDGGLTAILPKGEDFIIAPDGSFVGE